MAQNASSSKSASRRKALGRGLAALMPPPQTAKKADPAASTVPFRLVPIEKIHASRKQPRKHFDEAALEELAASIKSYGVLQPLLVRRAAAGYEIVAGERRWRAASRAGVLQVPVVIKEYTDTHALQVALIENVQRQDLDPLEEAEAYGRLIREHKLSHEQIALAVGKSRSAITNSMRLLKLPEKVLDMLADGHLSAGHARALMGLEDSKLCIGLAEDIVGRRATVREAEAKVRRLLVQKQRRSAVAADDADNASQSKSERSATASVQERLQQALKTKVRLVQRGGKGRIEIHFHSLDALDAVLDVILTS